MTPLNHEKITETPSFREKFSHFLTRSSTEFSRAKYQELLNDRGMENRLLDNLVEALPDGCIIAGGFMTTVIENEKEAGDIDFFFTSAKAFTDLFNLIVDQKRCKEEGFWSLEGYALDPKHGKLTEETISSLRYVNFIHPTRPALQLIKMVFFTDVNSVIDSFDLTIAQFAIDNTGYLTYNPVSFLDISRKRLCLHTLQFPVSTIRRIIKYSKKGFFACPGSLVKICEGIQKFRGKPDVNDIVSVD